MTTPFMFSVVTNFWTCSQIICTHYSLLLLCCNWRDSVMQPTCKTQTLILQCSHYFLSTYHSSKITRKETTIEDHLFCMKFELTFILLLLWSLMLVEYILMHCTQSIQTKQNSLCWQCNSNIHVIWCSASHFSFNSLLKTGKECAASSKKNVGKKVWLCFWGANWYAVANSFWNSHLWYTQIRRMEKDLWHSKSLIVQAQNLLLHIQNKCKSPN